MRMDIWICSFGSCWASHWRPIRDSYRIYWHTQKTAQRASGELHSTLKRRSKMDMDSPLKDPSICSSACWKWKIRVCPEKFMSLWNQTNTQRRSSLLLNAQQSPTCFRCQRRHWMSLIWRDTTHQMRVEEDWYQLWSTAQKLCEYIILQN